MRALPSVDALLRDARAEPLVQRYARAAVTQALRGALDEARTALAEGAAAPDAAALIERARRGLARLLAPSLRPVVNASGVVLHTNLGRAALADAAVAALTAAAAQPCNLEIDLADGGRGERDAHVEALLCALTGAEAAAVVNNNAAAVLLALNTLAEGREVVISRGELVEIGGAFRIPDVLAKSGAVLREVGTTNRTHARDYERAIGERTALLLKVHPSNYRIEGFTASAGVPELAALEVPVVHDIGSGLLAPHPRDRKQGVTDDAEQRGEPPYGEHVFLEARRKPETFGDHISDRFPPGGQSPRQPTTRINDRKGYS